MKLLIQFVADPGFMAKYQEACALLSNRLSNPTFEAVFGELLDQFLERHSPRERQARRQERQESTKTVPQRKSPSGSARRSAIPASTRDAVFVRDRGRCTYVGSNGKRCGETHHLHVDHITPVARRSWAMASWINTIDERRHLGGSRYDFPYPLDRQRGAKSS